MSKTFAAHYRVISTHVDEVNIDKAPETAQEYANALNNVRAAIQKGLEGTGKVVEITGISYLREANYTETDANGEGKKRTGVRQAKPRTKAKD